MEDKSNIGINSQTSVVVESSWIYGLFCGQQARVEVLGDLIHIRTKSGVEDAAISVESIEALNADPIWLWQCLTISLLDGSERRVSGLGGADAQRVLAAVQAAAIEHAQTHIEMLGVLLRRVEGFFAGDQYVRASGSRSLRRDLASVAGRCKGLIRQHVDRLSDDLLALITRLATNHGFEEARTRANEEFIRRNVDSIRFAAREGSRDDLTDEQAKAIATDEDVTLVLAGAGTGKTAVILGKIAHLVRNEGVSPGEILVLAFNVDAAKEVRRRLPEDLRGADVFTFHAFGRRVVAETGTAPTISKLATDSVALEMALDDAIRGILRRRTQSEDLTELIAYHRIPERSPFSFQNRGEYYEFVRKNELRTFSGDLVKSFEELEIANFLTLNGIEFEYEQPYRHATATREHRQYAPDFYIPGIDVYIEHFALDGNWRPPVDWARYGEGVEWKRSLHEQYGTRLIETYSWQHEKGVLRDTLRKSLESLGAAFDSKSMWEVVQQLAKVVVTWLARLIATFLNHFKGSGLTHEELRQRAFASHDWFRSRFFLLSFEQVHRAYQTLLAKEGAMDFHDLINNAASTIAAGFHSKPYRYVLVDEFQDISDGRMKLLQALKTPATAFFLVGDDWQSIYRFGGSDVGLVRDCGKYLGHVQQRELGQSFRYGKRILEPSSTFVQRNPAQTQRNLQPNFRDEDDGITIIADTEQERGLSRALQDIEMRQRARDASESSVLVLGRYRYTLPSRSRSVSKCGGLRIIYSTVHRAKGLEADFAIVLDLNDNKLGFPSLVEDDPLLRLVTPSSSGYPHDEERRLFYVAVTRARIGVYLIANPTRPSPFVNEIRRENDSIREIGVFVEDVAPSCPECFHGRLVPSQSLRNLRCTNHPMCLYLAPRCDCNAGFVVLNFETTVIECTNSGCDRNLPHACPQCKVGMLLAKDGKFGRFWGCNKYWSDPPCSFTLNSEPQRVNNLPRRGRG